MFALVAAILFYAYYLREKGIGMGARMPSLMSAVHKHDIKEMDTGYLYPDTADNRRRFKDWFRYVVVDQTLFFWILGSFTMFLFIVSGQSRPLYPPPLICGPLFFFIGQINRRTHEFNRKSNADPSFSRAVAGDSATFRA